MRKLTLSGGLLATGLLTIMSAGYAATTTNSITGNLADSDNNCTQITLAFTSRDCSFGNTRRGQTNAFVPPWQGFSTGSGFYALGSTGDDPNYNPSAGDTANGRFEPPLTGTINIDDNNTPGNLLDDLIDGTIIIGAASRNAATGQTTRVTESWTTYTHTFMPTVVNDAIDQGGGVTRYVVAANGILPIDACLVADPTDCFPTDAVIEANGPAGTWPADSPSSNVASTVTPSDGVGIARSSFFASGQGAAPAPPFPTGPAFGAAQTTATFVGYACTEGGTGNDDCEVGTLVWNSANSGTTPGMDDNPEDPGWDNLIFWIDVDANGDIIAGEAWWTQEYFIEFGINQAGTDNSWSGGKLINLAGTCTNCGPSAGVDTAAVLQATSDNPIDIASNDAGFAAIPTLSQSVAPDNGGSVTYIQATAIDGSGVPDYSVEYTPDPGFNGVETFTYQADDGINPAVTATVTVTVAANSLPIAPNGAVTASTQGGATNETLDIEADLGGQPGNGTPTCTVTQPTNGTASCAYPILTFAPDAPGGTMSSFDYTLSDDQMEMDTGTIMTDVTDVAPMLMYADLTTDQDTQGSTPATVTPGNGTPAQHTIAVSTDGTDGTCTVDNATFEVSYDPDPGFFGMDMCEITLTDADTSMVMAMVNVIVLEVVAPGGGTQPLEVEIPTTGSNSLAPWSLLALLGLPFVRRRRRV